MDSPLSFIKKKKCQILRRTMRTLLQDLAQKSLKGLGTKACTNWEDRSANSLAYQVFNHSIFLYAGCLSLQSSHLMRVILRNFKGYSSASELVADVSSTDIFLSEHVVSFTLKIPLFLLMNLARNPLAAQPGTLPFHLQLGKHWQSCCDTATCCSEPLPRCLCYSVTNFPQHTSFQASLRVRV